MAGDVLPVGRVLRAHGLRGELVVRPGTEGSDLLLHVDSIVLESAGVRRPHVVRAARPHGGQILLLLDGVADRTAAEALKGATLLVDSAELPPPEPGEHYVRDLIGLHVVSPAGESLGAVVDFESSPLQDWLVVDVAGRRCLVPFREPLARVDMKRRQVVVDAPEGLFDTL